YACGTKNSRPKKSTASPSSTNLNYATGFTVAYQNNTKLVEVIYPFQCATSGYKYLLVQKGESIPEHDHDVRIITIPITSIVCTSTTHIPLLDYLDETEKLVGFPSTDYISSVRARKLVDSGKIQDLGVDKGLNLERIAMLDPDMVMGYTMSGDYGQFKKVEELNVPVVINAEYLEKHPLGRAEWLKFMALFFNKEKEADSIFRVIEKNYLETKALADQVKSKPSVLSGVVYGAAWFLPGGQNYAAKLLRDAGCHYLWSENSSHGFLELSFESVYEKAYDADLWIGVGSFSSLQEVKDADHRYTRFKPFKQHQVYTSNARTGSKGGSEFLELGYLRPDIILKDLVKIAHPELLPEHELFFHRTLE
ncbi:MAG TPA: ABC transporter substrate-binding protein, partial [Chryseolinea sp.]|nr:ABC transporter substrate-binding protein [Chryseolinea sp.]